MKTQHSGLIPSLVLFFVFFQGYPVRKEIHHNLSQMTFPQIEEVNSTCPQIEEVDSEEPPSEAAPPKPPKKVLPDRMRAARDKANKKIVEFIVTTQGADEHLRAILKSRKQSQWLKDFLKASPYKKPIQTYLEDDNQQTCVIEYLQEVYRQVNAELPLLINGNSIEFVFAVLFPEVNESLHCSPLLKKLISSPV